MSSVVDRIGAYTRSDCQHCGSEFKQNGGRGRPRKYCSKACGDAAHWVKGRVSYVIRIYGISRERYEQAVARGSCECCGEEFRVPCVDHCHETGAVRGVVCHSCNIGLGHYEKKADLFREYLNKQGAKS